ncbi:hypothetical protein [Methanosarcina mazei]|nr:hypothetical protein [Methanosarcina mazei]
MYGIGSSRLTTFFTDCLDLARIALEELGCDIGIGLGRNSIHVDLRGQLTSWRYEGAELSENEFDQWVRDTCQQLGRRHSERAEYSERVLPKIIGPEVYVATDEAPAFYIERSSRSCHYVYSSERGMGTSAR